MLKYDSIAELIEAAKKQKMKISEMVLADQAAAAEADPQTLYARMERSFDVMCEAVESGSAKDQVSMSGLTGGEGYHMFDYAERTGGGLSGSFMTGAMARALSVAG